MTIHFDENGAKIDDQFVSINDTSIRLSEIQSLTEHDHQPGWEWPATCFIAGGLSLIIWLPAPIDNYPPGVVGAVFIAFGWYRLKNFKPKQYMLTAKASGFSSQVTFVSENPDQVERFRSVIEKRMAESLPDHSTASDEIKSRSGTSS